MPKSATLAKRFASLAVKAAALGVAMTVASYGMTASAAPHEHFTAFGWHSTEFDVRPFGEDVNPLWNEALQNAINTWNASHPEVRITLNQDSSNTVAFASSFVYNDGRAAEYKKLCLPAKCWFEITIDDEYIQAGPETIKRMGQFLILHELGHALGLNDFDPKGREEFSVMAYYMHQSEPPKLQPYDYYLIRKRVEMNKSRSLEQMIDTFAVGVLRPASEMIQAAFAVPEEPVEKYAEPRRSGWDLKGLRGGYDDVPLGRAAVEAHMKELRFGSQIAK